MYTAVKQPGELAKQDTTVPTTVTGNRNELRGCCVCRVIYGVPWRHTRGDFTANPMDAAREKNFLTMHEASPPMQLETIKAIT